MGDSILYSKTLNKTAAAAAIATLVFAIAAFKAAEWTRSSKVDLSAAAAPSNATDSITKVIPQIAIGSFDGGVTKYSTIVEVVNTGASVAALTGAFYNEDGDLWSVPMAADLGTAMEFTGTVPSITLPAGHVLVISGGVSPATTPSSGSIGWGRLIATGTVSITTFFEVRDGKTDGLLSRIGIAASAPDLSRFLIPRVHTKGGLDVAFAIVNTGTEPASIRATLKAANGTTIATRSIIMNGGTHQALFAHQFFSLSNETADRDYEYIVFNSDSSCFAAIALAFEGAAQTSFPVDRLN
ncbi:MAG TPA: hypothetical protein VGK48_10590 [Terriglobia bacterium]